MVCPNFDGLKRHDPQQKVALSGYPTCFKNSKSDNSFFPTISQQYRHRNCHPGAYRNIDINIQYIHTFVYIYML